MTDAGTVSDALDRAMAGVKQAQESALAAIDGAAARAALAERRAIVTYLLASAGAKARPARAALVLAAAAIDDCLHHGDARRTGRNDDNDR